MAHDKFLYVTGHNGYRLLAYRAANDEGERPHGCGSRSITEKMVAPVGRR